MKLSQTELETSFSIDGKRGKFHKYVIEDEFGIELSFPSHCDLRELWKLMIETYTFAIQFPLLLNASKNKYKIIFFIHLNFYFHLQQINIVADFISQILNPCCLKLGDFSSFWCCCCCYFLINTFQQITYSLRSLKKLFSRKLLS